MARKASYPVLLTANFCGQCDNNHIDKSIEAEKVISLSLKERKAYFNNPIHSNKDYLLFTYRTLPFRVPLVWIGRILNIYCPKIYYRLSGIRR